MKPLYEMTEDIRYLQALVDFGELTQDEITEAMENIQILDDDFNGKVETALKVRQELLGRAATIDKEIKRLQALKTAPANNAQRIADYIKENMLLTKKDKLDLGLFKVTLGKASKKLGLIDEEHVPDMYWTIVPATRTLNKALLLTDTKKYKYHFVELDDTKRALIIK